ncbi:MAG: hypothetical protein QME66_05355 [Candidatus Eisenbacteria bacterium]|nr:hypothetical protein [Candidatus Eisenbacteria bacterium]
MKRTYKNARGNRIRAGFSGSPGRDTAGCSRKGGTLIELVTVLVVLTTIAVLTGNSFKQSIASFDYVDKRKEILSEARVASERTMKELTRLRGRRDVLVANQTSVSFTDIDASTITLSWNGVPGTDLILTKNGSPNVLCSRVDSLAFQYLKSDGTVATPLVSPNSTDIWRVVLLLRVNKDGEKTLVRTSEFLRNL